MTYEQAEERLKEHRKEVEQAEIAWLDAAETEALARATLVGQVLSWKEALAQEREAREKYEAVRKHTTDVLADVASRMGWCSDGESANTDG